MNSLYKNIFCILGPTGIGKSLISMKLCDLLPLEIISVDSALIYKYLNIGTCKPSEQELIKYPHKLINILDPKEIYSVSSFFFDVINEIKNIYYNNKIPLLVGGTMMYYNILFNGLYILPKGNFYLRKYIDLLFNKYGSIYLYNLLYKIDYLSSIKIHYNDKFRIKRNLEIFLSTKKNVTYFKKNKKKKLNNINIYKIIILPNNKFDLINSIKNRFYNMLNIGFEDEVLWLYNRGDLNINMPSIKCIGYKQMWMYIQNKISYNKMIDDTINKTIYLIKKQYSWLKKWKNSYIVRLNNYNNCIKNVFNFINRLI